MFPRNALRHPLLVHGLSVRACAPGPQQPAAGLLREEPHPAIGPKHVGALRVVAVNIATALAVDPADVDYKALAAIGPLAAQGFRAARIFHYQERIPGTVAHMAETDRLAARRPARGQADGHERS